MRLLKEKGILAIILALLFLINVPLASAQLSQGEKDTILIGRLQIQPSVQETAQTMGYDLQLRRVAESLETQLINAIGMSGLFRVVERKRKSDIELEQAFATVAVNPNDKNAAQILKMTGAKYVLLVQIDGFEDIVEGQEHEALGRVSRQRKLFLSTVAQVVDTTTTEMLPATPSIQVEKFVEPEMVRAGTAMSSEKAMVELAKEMATKLAQSVICSLRPAKVLAITGQQILINRGTEIGFNPGDAVEVYATEDVKDEDTGAIVKNEVFVGKATISRSEPAKSFANLEGENLGVVKGCIVRPVINKPKAEEKVLTPGSSEKPLTWPE